MGRTAFDVGIDCRLLTYSHRVCRSLRGGNANAASVHVVPIPSDDAKARAFIDWAAAAGVEFPKLRLATFDGVRGMMASEGIAEDEVTASLPRDAVIALEPRAACPAWCDKDLWSSSPWFLKLSLLLLWEKSLGPDSRVRGYVESLPEALDTPIEWTDGEIERLQYPPILAAIRKQEKEWDGLFAEVQKRPKMTLRPSLQEFRWALGCVRSRSFSGPYVGSTLSDRLKVVTAVGVLAWGNVLLGSGSLEQTLNAIIAVGLFNILYEVFLSRMAKVYLLCPGVDLMNHSCRVETDLSYDYFRDQYSVRAPESYLKREQVFISYGRQSNDSLMQYYGFCEENNPDDVYVVSDMARWVATHPLVQNSGLEKQKLDGLGALKDVKVAPDGFPELTLNILRDVLVTIGEKKEDVEQGLTSVLTHACAQELESLGTSLTDDLDKLKNADDLDSRHEWALRFRIEKKRVLIACMEKMGTSWGTKPRQEVSKSG